MTMKTYRVLSELHHDRVVYLPGAEVEFDSDTAGPLLEVGCIAQPGAHGDDPSPSGDGEPYADIRAAIRRLATDNPALWTKSGKPQVEAVEHALGRHITAAERDAAWAAEQGGEQ